jgi:hypothetical protein
MPNPFRDNPKNKWAKKFRKSLRDQNSFRTIYTRDKYVRGVMKYLERRTEIQIPEEVKNGNRQFRASDFPNSDAIQGFKESQRNHTRKAIKVLTVLAAGEYLREIKGTKEYDNINSGLYRFEEYTEFDEVNPGDFDLACVVLSNKFVSNWADAYS